MTDLRIVRGTATDEEVAAVVAALAVLRRRPTATAKTRSRWADRALLLRQPPTRR